MQRLVRHSGQWYWVFRRRILPHSSTVFQQKLQLSGGPDLTAGVWLARWVCDVSDAADSKEADVEVAVVVVEDCLSADDTVLMRRDLS